MHHFKLFIVVLAVGLLTPAEPSSADDYGSFVYAGCSQSKYTPGTPYQYNVDSLLTSLANSAAVSPYGKFTSSGASSSYPVYGLYQCRGDLQVNDCDSCVHSAISQLSVLCPSAAGGTLQLRGCLIRYGNDSFIGKQDTSVLYKKCGPDAPGGYNSDVFGMRDAALAAVAAGQQGARALSGGLYRVGAAGYVQAMAQCVGDLSAKQCDDCVSAAVGQLKSVCSAAVSGDVYLGKCYARYWSNGVYGSHSNHGGDKTGKTLAIIIGLMAGIALLIIFLSFLRRAGHNEKY